MTENNEKPKKLKGFAAIKARNPELLLELCRKGGISAHEQGKAHRFTREEAQEAGRKGGAKVREERGRDYYSQIGKKGGENSRKGQK